MASTVSTSRIATIRDHRKLTVFQPLGDRAVGLFYRIAFIGSVPVGFKESRISHHAFVCEVDYSCGASDDECYNYLAHGRFVVKTRINDKESCNEVNRRPIWVIAGEDSVLKVWLVFLGIATTSCITKLSSTRPSPETITYILYYALAPTSYHMTGE